MQIGDIDEYGWKLLKRKLTRHGRVDLLRRQSSGSYGVYLYDDTDDSEFGRVWLAYVQRKTEDKAEELFCRLCSILKE